MASITDAMKRQLRAKSPSEQFEQDVQAITAFIENPAKRSNPNERARVKGFVIKLFRTIRYGGLLFRENAAETTGPHGWQWWHYTGMPLASVLGHGGRVMIQYHTPAFPRWLFDEAQHQWSGRFSTHNMEKQPAQNIPGFVRSAPRRKLIKEIKVGGHGSKGLDAAIWGAENNNPHSRNRVTRNGTHGHFCIVRDFQDKGVGGILIGLEGSGPNHSDQYGGSHGPDGSSGEFSPTGSRKWRYLKMGPGSRFADQKNGKYDYDDFFDESSPPSRKRKIRRWKHKVFTPPAADSMLILIPPDWTPRDFTPQPWNNAFLGRTTQQPKGWQESWNTPMDQRTHIQYTYTSRLQRGGARGRIVRRGGPPPAQPPRGRCPRHPDQEAKCPICDDELQERS
jgi:hypothetical protein